MILPSCLLNVGVYRRLVVVGCVGGIVRFRCLFVLINVRFQYLLVCDIILRLCVLVLPIVVLVVAVVLVAVATERLDGRLAVCLVVCLIACLIVRLVVASISVVDGIAVVLVVPASRVVPIALRVVGLGVRGSRGPDFSGHRRAAT